MTQMSSTSHVDAETARRNRRTALWLMGVIVGMVALSMLARANMMHAIFKL